MPWDLLSWEVIASQKAKFLSEEERIEIKIQPDVRDLSTS